MNDLAWLDAHVRAVYAHDAFGRFEPGEDVPRFWLGRTRLGNLWRMRADLSAEQVRGLARLAAREAPYERARAIERRPRIASILGLDAPPPTIEWLFRVDHGEVPAAISGDGPANDIDAVHQLLEEPGVTVGSGPTEPRYSVVEVDADAGRKRIAVVAPVERSNRVARAIARRLGSPEHGDVWSWP